MFLNYMFYNYYGNVNGHDLRFKTTLILCTPISTSLSCIFYVVKLLKSHKVYSSKEDFY